MNDMGDVYRAWKEIKKEKKESNLDNSMRLLDENGVTYTSHNNGYHVIIYTAAKTVDFWPTTGKFIIRGGSQGRGVNDLLKFLKRG